jgi:hypothetical protein
MAGFGAGIDMRALDTAMKAFAAAVREQPFRCEDLASFNRLAETIATAPAAIPKQVFDITGVGMVLRDFDPKPGAPNVDGVVVVGLRDPKGALTALAPLIPNVRLDKLGKRGVPVRAAELVRSTPSPTLENAWFALGKQSVGLSMGDAGKRELVRALDRQRKDDRALVVWTFDFATWLRRHPEALHDLGTVDANARKFAEAMLGFLGPTEFKVRATDRGLETEATLEMPKRKR